MVEMTGFMKQIRDDLRSRLPNQRKTQRDKLAILVATMLEVRTGSVMELGHGLPLETTDSLSRFQWIKRFLANDLVDVNEVIGSFSREVLERVHRSGTRPILIIDQSTISSFERHELVMVALRMGKRSIPIAWRVYKASGSLGWREQSEVLEVARSFLPSDCKPILMGDRFYGNTDLITWCDQHKWDYYLRLKGSMFLSEAKDAKAKDIQKLDALWAAGKHQFESAYLTRKAVKTNIQMIKDKGAKEPWIIAMSAPPSLAEARKYAKRWGIECMFSDFKSRGFGILDSQLRIAERINRLILIMAIALYWAVSTGVWMKHVHQAQKKDVKSIVDQWFQSSNSGSELSLSISNEG